tara:strand:+ start:1393 stop:3126 length:1734 start_codon:yes stop_codon:yes gene_type:complete
MSGLPLTSPLDADKFRREYLNTLKLQTKNDDKNYRANLLYQQTGIPQQPTDTRTFDEKMRDIEGLKQVVRGDLTAIMDSTQANKVVQSIASEDLKYLSVRIDDIVLHTKRKWKNGVNADIFIGILNEYANAEGNVYSLAEGVQNTSKLLLTTDSIVSNMANKDDLTEVLTAVRSLQKGDARTRALLIDNIGSLLEKIPTEAELTALIGIRDASLQNKIQRLLTTALKDIPTRAELEIAINYLEQSSSASQLNDALRRLNGIVGINDQIQAELENIKGMIASSQSQIQTGGGGYIPPEIWRGLNKTQLTAYIDTISKFPAGKALLSAVGGKSKLKNNQLIMSFLEINDDEIKLAFSTAGEVLVPIIATPVKGVAVAEAEVAGTGRMRGRGVGRPKSRNYEGSTRPKRSDNLTKEDIDYSKGVSYVSPRFVPLGKYVINKGQLDKNIISIKTKSGGCISGFKSQRTSAKMGGVLRKIIGGNIPSFNEIDELDDVDKSYLHKVASVSGIIDKLSIPAPDKTAEDRDIDQFDLMKGQILSGNDNKEYIKKFKLLVMKLSKEDLLPMRQAKEVLYELAMLGY